MTEGRRPYSGEMRGLFARAKGGAKLVAVLSAHHNSSGRDQPKNAEAAQAGPAE